MKNFAICTFAIILGTCLSINNAFAVYQNNQYVTAVGTHDSLQGQGNNTDPRVWVQISPNPDGCAYGYVIFDTVVGDSNMTIPELQTVLSIAMAANLSQQKVYIQYSGGAGSWCYGASIMICNAGNCI